MSPDFHDGDVIILDPNLDPGPGDYVFAEDEDSEAKLFRKFRPQILGRGAVDTFDLVPANPDWPTIRVTSDMHWKISGVMSERITPRRRAP